MRIDDRTRDRCRHCGEPITYRDRWWVIDADPYGDTYEKRRGLRVTDTWIHDDRLDYVWDGGDRPNSFDYGRDCRVDNLEGHEGTDQRRSWRAAEPKGLCHEVIEGERYTSDFLHCHRKVKDQESMTCGIHMRPHIERREAVRRRADKEAKEELAKELRESIVNAIEEYGIKAQFPNSYTEDVLVNAEDLLQLLESDQEEF